MGTKLLCKFCESIIESTGDDDIVYCKCGKLACAGSKPPMKVLGETNGFWIVDDKGNRIVVDEKPKDNASDNEIYTQLLMGVAHIIETMENMSPGGKFSPVTNQDLLAHLIWVKAMIETLYRLIERTPRAASS